MSVLHDTIDRDSYTCWDCGAVSTPAARLIFVSQTQCWACGTGRSLSPEENARYLLDLGRPFLAWEQATDEELH